MRILTLVSGLIEETPAISVASKLSANLFANVDLLTVVRPEDCPDGRLDVSVTRTLLQARKLFIDRSASGGPYTAPILREEAVLTKPGRYDIQPVVETGKKELRLRIRVGEPGREITNEAYEEDADLIIMNIPVAGPREEEDAIASLKVAAEASCSVLIVKEESEVGNMIVGVENPQLRQTAREMLTQIATVFHAPVAMYPLPSDTGRSNGFSEAMGKLVKIFKAHDLNVITAEAASANPTINELMGRTRQNMLVLR